MAGTRKQSYTLPCSSAFRDAVTGLAEGRGINVGDLARSVVLVLPAAVVEAFPDPGGPEPEDRETVIVKSGAARGRPWRRKPRLQVRLAPGYAVPTLRRALGLALALGGGALTVRVEKAGDGAAAAKAGRTAGEAAPESREAPPRKALGVVPELLEEVERLRAIVSALSFDPLPEGVRSREDALHVLGFAPGRHPSLGELRARFHLLATIHHPDTGTGSHRRMSQLNAAMALLRLGG